MISSSMILLEIAARVVRGSPVSLSPPKGLPSFVDAAHPSISNNRFASGQAESEFVIYRESRVE